MADPLHLICSRCGRQNAARRLFCEGCGLGLEVVRPIRTAAAGGGRVLLDAPVGSLVLYGVGGALAGLAVSGLILLALLRLLRGTDDLESAAALLGVFIWRGIPAV